MNSEFTIETLVDHAYSDKLINATQAYELIAAVRANTIEGLSDFEVVLDAVSDDPHLYPLYNWLVCAS